MADGPTTLWYHSLPFRVFALTAAIVGGVIALAVATTLWIGRNIGVEAARDAVDHAAAIQTALLDRRLDQLDLMAQVFVSEPALAAYVARASQEGDVLSILDLLDERQDDLGFDFAILLDDTGKALVRTDAPTNHAEDLSGDPLIARAMADYGAAGVWKQRGILYNVSVAPISTQFVLEGFLVVGFALDESSALELRRVSDAEVTFVTENGPDDSDPQFKIAGTTLEPGTAEELVHILTDWRKTNSPNTEATSEIVLDGRKWIMRTMPLGSRDRPAGISVSLASLDSSYAPFRQVGKALLWTGSLAILVAASLLFFFTTRTLRPVGRLSSLVEAAAEGNYDQHLGSKRTDEVGQLARSFDRLLSDLREKRDTEKYLSTLARTIHHEATTMNQSSWGMAGSNGVAPTDSSGPEDETVTISSGPKPAGGGAPPAIEGEPALGTVLGERFELLAVLGRGGMGVVYKASDRTIDEIVALKIVRPDVADPVWLERLKDELRLARRVTHPNVLRTHGFEEIDGVGFITMEFVRGVTLRYLLSQTGRLPYSAGLRLARELCRGLEAAHANNVLHRDIKPENLLIEPNGNAKLMDFGLAKPPQRFDDPETEVQLAGTPDYIAPEQLTGEEATEQSDIYACGVVFYEIFTGRRPFDPIGDRRKRMLRKLKEDPPPPRSVYSEVPDRLERLILRCLEREPVNRYADVSELLEDLAPLRS